MVGEIQITQKSPNVSSIHNSSTQFKSFRQSFQNQQFEQKRADFRVVANQLLVKTMKKQGLLSKNKSHRNLNDLLYKALDANLRLNFSYDDRKQVCYYVSKVVEHFLMELTEDHIRLVADSYATAFVNDNLQFESLQVEDKKAESTNSPQRSSRKTKQDRKLGHSKDVSSFKDDVQ